MQFLSDFLHTYDERESFPEHLFVLIKPHKLVGIFKRRNYVYLSRGHRKYTGNTGPNN
jgi:hypothetical protein